MTTVRTGTENATRMDREIKTLRKKWVKALTSGDFKQHRGAYVNEAEDAYCCMGVLGCVAFGVRGKAIHAAAVIELSGALCKAAGISHSFFDTLVTMNDRENKSFSEIAAYIKKQT